MPSWGEVQQEINALGAQGIPFPLDQVRKKYLAELSAKTGRTTIVYYSGWLAAQTIAPHFVINDDDKVGFMQAAHAVDHGGGLDLLLHTLAGQLPPQSPSSITCSRFLRAICA
jgi:ClpP class serine protease